MRFKLAVFIIAGIFVAAPLCGESNAELRLLPAYYFPVNDDLFQGSFGTAAVFDFMLTPAIGFFAQGEYIGLSLENVDAIPLIDGSIGAGFSWNLHDRFSLRTDILAGVYSVTAAGMGEDGEDSTQSGISAGARVSGAFHLSPMLTASIYGGYRYFARTFTEPFLNSFSVGVALTLNLKEAFNPRINVSVQAAEQEPVFPVLYSWYDDNNFAVIQVTNNEQNDITDVNVSFFLEQYMGQPKLCATIPRIAPGETVSIPATAFFNEAMLGLTERVDAEAEVIVEYRRLGMKKKGDLPVTIPVFHRNAMSWEDNRRAAAFVSSKDPAALWFSKYISSIVADRFRDGVNRNIQYAMGLYEGLKVYGINYVIDPTSSYQDLATDAGAIDFLQYPYQTLMYRAGDCDDLSILFCSLLEAVGIDTAFITIPGHIFMAFDSGMTEEEAKADFFAPSQLIYHEGRAWVPVEITIIKEGFNKAWRIGAKEWNDAAARGTAEIFPMAESWRIYKPVSVPGAASRFNLPDETLTARAFDTALNMCVETEIRPKVRTLKAVIADNDTPEAHNQLGIVYGEYGMLREARAEFTIAAKRGYMPAWTNLGNLLFMEQKYEDALNYFTYVLSQDQGDHIALLGSARCYYELDDFANSDVMYTALMDQDPALGGEYSYLASFFETQGRAWSLSDRLSTTPWSPFGTKGKAGERLADRVEETFTVASAPVTAPKAGTRPAAVAPPDLDAPSRVATVQPETPALEVPAHEAPAAAAAPAPVAPTKPAAPVPSAAPAQPAAPTPSAAPTQTAPAQAAPAQAAPAAPMVAPASAPQTPAAAAAPEPAATSAVPAPVQAAPAAPSAVPASPATVATPAESPAPAASQAPAPAVSTPAPQSQAAPAAPKSSGLSSMLSVTGTTAKPNQGGTTAAPRTQPPVIEEPAAPPALPEEPRPAASAVPAPPIAVPATPSITAPSAQPTTPSVNAPAAATSTTPSAAAPERPAQQAPAAALVQPAPAQTEPEREAAPVQQAEAPKAVATEAEPAAAQAAVSPASVTAVIKPEPDTAAETAEEAEEPEVVWEREEAEPEETAQDAAVEEVPPEAVPAAPPVSAPPEQAEIQRTEEQMAPFRRYLPAIAAIAGGMAAVGAGISLQVRKIRRKRITRK